MDPTFITHADIGTYTTLNSGVTADRTTPLILQAQRRYTRTALGVATYDALVAAYVLSQLDAEDPAYVALPAPYQTLLDEYVKPSLACRTLVLALPVMNVQLTQAGPRQQYAAEGSAVPDTKAVNALVTSLVEQADWYENEARNFCTNNPGDFPGFAPVTNPAPRRPVGGLVLDMNQVDYYRQASSGRGGLCL